MQRFGAVLFGLICIGLLCPPVSFAQSLVERTAEQVRMRIEAASAGLPALQGEGEPVHARPLVTTFYVERGFAPGWTRRRGPAPQVDSLLRSLSRADRLGLHPSDYHIEAIRTVLREIRSSPDDPVQARRMADLELLCTDAFLLYAAHRLSGRVDPEALDPEWRATRRAEDMLNVLNRALTTGRIERTLAELDPPQTKYRRLQAALDRYRQIANEGGWPIVSTGPTLRLGDEGERVAALRERLRITGNWTPHAGADTIKTRFDSTLAASVRRFQTRHGLDVDGVVGMSTLAALNVPAKERVEQLQLNLERWRWLPQDLGTRHIIVNIAGFELEVVEQGATALQMRVITGQQYRRTPVFSGQITYLVFSPYWHVPPSIAVNDKLPLLRKNPAALSAQGYEIFRGWGADAKAVDPTTVDWSAVSTSSFPYRLRQRPGPNNALGRVKFMFPNPYNVYLHDTPSRELFARAERSFSSGCIRVEQPLELADYLLADQPEWTRSRMQQVIDSRREATVRLKQAIPVHLLYWTAWIEKDGAIHFRRDIYGRDARLQHAMERPLPAGNAR